MFIGMNNNKVLYIVLTLRIHLYLCKLLNLELLPIFMLKIITNNDPR